MEKEIEESDEERMARIRLHMQTPIEDVIAEQKFIIIIGSERREICLQIGHPYKGAGEGEYRCPVASWGVYDRYPDMCGEGSLQALALAVRCLETTVIDWINTRDARLQYPGVVGDSESGVDALQALFGQAMPKKRRRHNPRH